jgi:tetratricopeptide (TPR) repeat protein
MLAIGFALLMSVASGMPGASGAGRTQQAGSDAARVIAEARELIAQGRARDAIARLETLDRADAAVAHALGVAFYHADEHERAIQQLAAVRDRLADGSTERREAVQILGLCYYLTGRFADAVPLLEQTREWARENLELGYILGLAYIQTRKPDAARASLAHTYRLPPDSAAAHVLAAQLMLRLEMEPQAEAELKRALEKDARVPRANFLLGQIALFRGRLDEAVALTERELSLNPTDAMALSQLGDALGRGSKNDEAIAALQKSLWLNPYYSGPYILLGRAYMKKGQPATAEGMLRRAIQYDPNNRSAHYLLAQLLQQTGRIEEAKREFAIAERLAPPGR